MEGFFKQQVAVAAGMDCTETRGVQHHQYCAASCQRVWWSGARETCAGACGQPARLPQATCQHMRHVLGHPIQQQRRRNQELRTPGRHHPGLPSSGGAISHRPHQVGLTPTEAPQLRAWRAATCSSPTQGAVVLVQAPSLGCVLLHAGGWVVRAVGACAEGATAAVDGLCLNRSAVGEGRIQPTDNPEPSLLRKVGLVNGVPLCAALPPYHPRMFARTRQPPSCVSVAALCV